jgi:hypothetical protein
MNNRVTDNSGSDSNQQVKKSDLESKTIYQEKLEKNNNNSNKKLIYSLFIFLILILVGVVFILPNFINQANQQNEINPTEELNNLEIDRSSQSTSKPIAQALISELLVKIEDLKTNGVLFWGGDSWLNAMELYEMGDQSYTSGAFNQESPPQNKTPLVFKSSIFTKSSEIKACAIGLEVDLLLLSISRLFSSSVGLISFC